MKKENNINKRNLNESKKDERKSRNFDENKIIQCALKEESFVVIDPKGELYPYTNL